MKTRTLRLAAWIAALGLMAPTLAMAKGHSKTTLAGVVNINSANAEQLDLLPYVGPKSAQAILSYRVKHPFKRIEDLVKVKGLGPKKFAKLKPYVRVTGPTTLHAVKHSHARKRASKKRASKPEALLLRHGDTGRTRTQLGRTRA